MVTNFLMFFISFTFIFASSYFITGIFTPQNKKSQSVGFLILLTSMFAQIVLSYEVLSLFSAINAVNILTLHAFMFAISMIFWIKNNKKIYKPEPIKLIKKIFNTLKKDKILMIMFIGLIFFIFITIAINIFMPVINYDALSYHLNRVAFWLSQGDLNHFAITDDRNLVMPINSEILYFWVLTFFKSDIGLNFFSLIGYLTCVYSVYNILEYFKFSERRKLWAIIILSSFASVVVEVSSVETDVLIAGIILSAITIYLYAIKEKSKSLIFFSALAYSLAMGTKSPAIIAFPGVFILLTYFTYKQNSKEWLKPISAFLLYLFVTFIIFSSYNYILNFINYGDFLGSESAKAIHGFRGGFKAFVANYIRYIFMLFDFSGFKYSEYVGETITNAKLAIFSFLQIPPELGVEMTDNNKINNRLLEVKMGMGLLGFLLFLPALFTSIILKIVKSIKKEYSSKINAMFIFAITFFINICCLSFSIAYMVFSIRFVTTMGLISSPVLAITYIKNNKNILKWLILFFVMSYFLVMSTNISARPVLGIIKTIKQEKSIKKARERIRCALYKGYTGVMPFCHLKDIIKSTPTGTKFAVFPGYNARLYPVKMLDNEGYTIDIYLPELAEQYDYQKYDYIIKTDYMLISTVLLTKTKDTKANYKLDKNLLPIFFENNNVQCAYVDHKTGMTYDPTKENQTIISSYCYMPDGFFEKKGFNLTKTYNFHSDIRENANYMTIYKNKNK